MRIVCVSDTHLQHGFSVPDGDVLIHAGDGTLSGSWRDMGRWLSWLHSLPHRRKLVVAGDHDWLFQLEPEATACLMPPSIVYLEDSGITIAGVRFWGAPWQPGSRGRAFNLPRGAALARKWELIPANTQVLITHPPPQGILDGLPDQFTGARAGCEALRLRSGALEQLRLHVFGHIHQGYGVQEDVGRTFVNACICDAAYLPANPAVVVDL